MIDSKKIEEAAKQHAEEAFISGYWQACYKEGFMGCAKWMQEEFLKDLWYPASEEPRKGAKFLYQNHYNSRFYYYIGKIDDILETYPNWSSYVKHVRVIQWLYIDDLFPKKGGEK